MRSYRQNLHDHVLPRLGGYLMDAITRQDIIGLLRQKQGDGYSGNSIRLMIAPLSRLMSDAIDEGIIEHNPCLRPGRILQLRARKREAIALSIEERDRLLSTFASEFLQSCLKASSSGTREAVSPTRRQTGAATSNWLIMGPSF